MMDDFNEYHEHDPDYNIMRDYEIYHMDNEDETFIAGRTTEKVENRENEQKEAKFDKTSF